MERKSAEKEREREREGGEKKRQGEGERMSEPKNWVVCANREFWEPVRVLVIWPVRFYVDVNSHTKRKQDSAISIVFHTVKWFFMELSVT